MNLILNIDARRYTEAVDKFCLRPFLHVVAGMPLYTEICVCVNKKGGFVPLKNFYFVKIGVKIRV